MILLLEVSQTQATQGDVPVSSFSPIRGDRLSGFVLPIEPTSGDVQFNALRGWAWSIDDTQRLRLEGDVHISIGSYRFTSNRVLVWLNRIPSADGLITQFALFFDESRSPTSPAGLTASGRNIFVTGSSRGEVSLDIAVLHDRQANRDGFNQRGETQLADYLRKLNAQPQTLTTHHATQSPKVKEEYYPVPGGKVPKEHISLPTQVELPPEEHPTPWLQQPHTVVRFSAHQIHVETSDIENVITAEGSVVLEYASRISRSGFREISLSAERAVMFTDPGRLEEIAQSNVDAEMVRGIYLEGNVVAQSNNGEYIVRAPKMYYDFRTGQAIMLNSILRTHIRGGRTPIYARAEEMRQLADNQWEAQHVRILASEFYTGHLALGASKATITRQPSSAYSQEEENHLDSRNITLRAGDLPIFYWPVFRGTLHSIPLKSIEVGTEDNDGARILTKWNPFSLLGLREPTWGDSDLLIDVFSKRGVGVGFEMDYKVAASEGMIDLYGLYDDGIDRTSSGREVNYDEEFRGLALWENRTRLSRYWSLQSQLSYISDPTFITAWREEDFKERREYETSLYLKYQKNRSAFTFLVQQELNDFISNSYLLASRQYQVEHTPDMTYRLIGQPLFKDRANYTGHLSATRMRFRFDQSTPAELGVRGRAFGIGENDVIEDELVRRGFRDNYVGRLDSRHEFSRPTTWGIFRIVPFAAGRATYYENADFEPYSADSDELRLFGSVGVRVNTQFQRVFNDVEHRLLDLHRLRHLIEPSLTLWYGYSTVSAEDLPIYDERVEPLLAGTAIRLGLRNTFQTQRGGPGYWHSVDFLTIDTELVLHSNDADQRSPAPFFMDFWPEYSYPGEYFHGSVSYLPSDSLSFVGEGIYDLDEGGISRGSFGVELRHSLVLTSSIEYRYLEASNNELIGLGWVYQLSPKYRLQLNPQWDMRQDEFRALNLRVTRRFPDVDFIVQVRYDSIRDETTFGASLNFITF